jgi:hypothetical protein
VLQTHLPTSLADLTGLAAGIGIILLARSPDGILGMQWLTNRVHLPFADDQGQPRDLVLDHEVAHAA